jgi:hypothetical protein
MILLSHHIAAGLAVVVKVGIMVAERKNMSG